MQMMHSLSATTFADSAHTRRLMLALAGAALLYVLGAVALVSVLNHSPATVQAPPPVKVSMRLPRRAPSVAKPVVAAPMPAKPAVVRPKPARPVLAKKSLTPPVPVVEPVSTALPSEGADVAPGDPAAPADGATEAPARRAPIQLPENATPPVAAADNVMPAYPESARQDGIEAQVILKIVVSDSGDVEQINVMRGEEPFVSSAVAAVRTWHYQPALVDGAAAAVFRIVKIPFRLRD